MSRYYLLFLTFLLFGSSCGPVNDKGRHVKEIIDVEADFERMVAEKGMKEAFLFFADEKAVLNRNNRIIKGHEAIGAYFDELKLSNSHLTWSPDFIDISRSHDMAYTYGTYYFIALDSTGAKIESKGTFHTVWKKQADGSWKYVYD